ncbi:UNVERIFIED_CONTAM: hypothetical protein FKN15_029417 [Acipenser sinensis]
MAEANIIVAEDQFSCPVCLEILKDPVTTACGHSYCMGCIKNCWDQTDHTGVYSCPQCRETFTPRPVLRRNTVLTEVVEKLKKTRCKPPPAQTYAGPGDVPCDFCTGRKFKAVKSCLTCLASYCETHIKPHYEGAAFKRHKPINAIGNLEQKLCAKHQKVLDVYCRTDQTCICVLCTVKEHKSHDTVSAEKERTGKQRSAQIEIKESEKIFTELIRSIEKIHAEVIELIGANEKAAVNQAEGCMKKLEQEIAELRRKNAELKQLSETDDHIHFLQRSAQIEIKESEKIFTELIRSIEKIHAEVIELIGANEKAAVNQAEGCMKKLEQEIAELRRKNAELKQLSETDDHIHFLQNFQSLCAPPDLLSITINTDISFGAVRKAVSEIKDHIEDFCKDGLSKITKTDSCQLTLDPNTAYRELCLSEGNRKVTLRGETQPYPDHPERFDYWEQVLCREGLSGTRFYWEIEWSGDGAEMGVTYKGISRKGEDNSCILGRNDKSWSLEFDDSSYTAWHNNKKTVITAPYSTRIGVYLDFNAGTLSFYGVSDTMTLLHRFQTTFTEMLYPALWPDCDSTVTICQLN